MAGCDWILGPWVFQMGAPWGPSACWSCRCGDCCCCCWGWQAWGRGNGIMGDHYASEWHLHALLEDGQGICNTQPIALHMGAAAWPVEAAGAVAAGAAAVALAAVGGGTCWVCGSFCCWHSLGRRGWQGMPKVKGPQAAWQAMAAKE